MKEVTSPLFVMWRVPPSPTLRMRAEHESSQGYGEALGNKAGCGSATDNCFPASGILPALGLAVLSLVKFDWSPVK